MCCLFVVWVLEKKIHPLTTRPRGGRRVHRLRDVISSYRRCSCAIEMSSLPDDNNPAKKCYYLASKGASGLAGLKAIIQYGKRQSAPWLSTVQLHGACMNNHVDTTVPYLMEQLGTAIVDNVDEDGNTPLHTAIIWGRNSVVVYLLSRGASIYLKNRQGQNGLEIAKERLSKLLGSGRQSTHLKGNHMSKAEVEKLMDDAKDLVFILTNVYTCKSYKEFAKQFSHHYLVQKHSRWAYRGQQRLTLCLLLRHLVTSNRATFKSLEEIYALNLAKEMASMNIGSNAEAGVHSPAEQNVDQKSIAEILTDHGLNDNICFARSLKLLEVFEPKDLRPIDKSMIVQLDLTSKERRRLWNMIKEEKEKLPDIKEQENTKGKPKKKLSRKEKKAIEEQRQKEREEKMRKEEKVKCYIRSLKILCEPKMPELAVNAILRFIY